MGVGGELYYNLHRRSTKQLRRLIAPRILYRLCHTYPLPRAHALASRVTHQHMLRLRVVFLRRYSRGLKECASCHIRTRLRTGLKSCGALDQAISRSSTCGKPAAAGIETKQGTRAVRACIHTLFPDRGCSD